MATALSGLCVVTPLSLVTDSVMFSIAVLFFVFVPWHCIAESFWQSPVESSWQCLTM